MSICVEHTQKGDKDGYGLTSRKGKNVRLHRIVYCDANNIPLTAILGLVIRHTCDNPRCVNPKHLLLGTPQDNIADKVNRNRQARGQAIQQSVLTPQEIRAEIARERREAVKARDLDRRTKRQNKRSQCY